MSYGKRRYYRKGCRSSNGFGSMVRDTVAIANKFGVLLACIGTVSWKAFTRTALNLQDQRDMSTFATLSAQFF